MCWRIGIHDHCKKLSTCSGYFPVSPSIACYISWIAFSGCSLVRAITSGCWQE
ncbi:hypothetical protein KPSA1_00756 [Pseudomonas syringae pv. actinidiae]|uniref:Uncharacterized protein n=1 Tax=Pseudomonas syringae pv. actinidiae TaxID=103796 RepID=A0A2V0Q4B5_PSESF|nr:hypothetical protein KPSA1_00756 [Pseudomonas syringae pv. actinidiae]